MIDFLIATSFLVNPILALVFNLNLCSLIIKASKSEYQNIRANIIWISISCIYIITTLTWMFAAL